MKVITVSSAFSTGFDPTLSSARAIEVEDRPFAEGGFGAAFRVQRIDGRTVAPQVVKILVENGQGVAQKGFATVQELQKRLSVENSTLLHAGTSVIQRYPALQAVPQVSFVGQFEGRQVLGYCANDLSQSGFEEFGRLLEDAVRVRQFQALPLGRKTRLAEQLVNAFDFLSNHVRFIHADIKADALFVDIRNSRLAVIDFDSGALARDPSDTPTTWGTPQDFLAPEIIRQLENAGNGPHSIKVNLLSDVWSVNIAVHYLLFGAHPLFFLKELSQRSIEAYFQRYQWPDADPAFAYFRKEYRTAYAQYARFLRTGLPRDLVTRLAFTINRGYFNPSARTTYGQWKTVLKAINRPAILRFGADRTFVNEAGPVHLSWEVTGALRLELGGIGEVTNLTSIDIPVQRDTDFRLVLTPENGSPIVKTVRIVVNKRPPEIHSFRASQTLLLRGAPVHLSWNVTGYERLDIDNGIGSVSKQTSVNVCPRRDTTYKLTATSLFGVSTTAEVGVKVSTVPPSIAFFRSDRKLLTDHNLVTLNWDVSDDAHEVLLSGIGKVARSGKLTISQRRDTVYTLRARSYFGFSSSASVQVLVSKAPPVIEVFTASPAVVREGSEVVVIWKVSGAESVRIEPSFEDVSSEGRHTIWADKDTHLTLNAVSYFGVGATRSIEISLLKTTALQAPTEISAVCTMLAASATTLIEPRNTPPPARTTTANPGTAVLPGMTNLAYKASNRN